MITIMIMILIKTLIKQVLYVDRYQLNDHGYLEKKFTMHPYIRTYKNTLLPS